MNIVRLVVENVTGELAVENVSIYMRTAGFDLHSDFRRVLAVE